jgi:uncharacterized protein YggE
MATEVSGAGTVLVPYDLVNFVCEVSAFSSNGVNAKKLIKGAIDELCGYYDVLKAEGKTRNKRSSMAVNPTTKHVGKLRSKEETGYTAKFILEFSTLDVDAVGVIHDQLTSIEGVAAKAPAYTFTTPEKYRRLALEEAWIVVKDRFAHQCSVLGVNPNDYHVEQWGVDFNDRRETFSKVANYAQELVGPTAPDVDGGIARVSVTLNVEYAYNSE